MEERYLVHYGTPRHSGRYPWGSGEYPYQRTGNFLSRYEELKTQGLTEVEIANSMGLTSTDLRAEKELAKTERKAALQSEVIRLHDSGMSNTAIGRQIGKPESSVRALLEPTNKARNDRLIATRDLLKKQVEEKNYIDVGEGVEQSLGISKQMLDNAVITLKNEGYEKINYPETQRGTGLKTTIKILAKPGTTVQEIRANRDKVGMINERWSEDAQEYSALGLKPVKSISSKRVMVNYDTSEGDNISGGKAMDGVIQLRRGVEGLDMGNARYAQVRIGVDGKYFLKGMAVYSDDMPDGIDIIYNSNKSPDTPKKDVFKPMKTTKDGEIDQENPFGTSLKLDENGHPIQKGYLNIVKEEGDWDTWNKSLASQFLSKQSQSLINKQLKITYDEARTELDSIKALNNPAVKKQLLKTYADSIDSDVEHLAAAAMPRQNTRVILPVTDLKENQIYAPSYKNGEQVVLIRYPHGGKFEIPELTVANNASSQAKSMFEKNGGSARDAVCINAKVAERLSGADFDGDTVLVIPNNRKEIKTEKALEGLKGFDPSAAYPGYEGIPDLPEGLKQKLMGVTTNLITDMTLKGASPEELTRAVKHSMVVIDAQKHHLNYKQSYEDNGIKALTIRYQGHVGDDGEIHYGASTVISRAKNEKRVPQRRMSYHVDENGNKVYVLTGEKTPVYKKDKETGKKVIVGYTPKLTKSTQMAEADDAFTLSSGTPQETAYATHANKLKDLAREARKEWVNTPNIEWSQSARKTYSKEVESLNASLNRAKSKAPYERKAQLIANSKVAAARSDNPDLTKKELSKIGTQALAAARASLGLKKSPIEISPKEWEAIQAGALSESNLEDILKRTDIDIIRDYATPASKKEITAAKRAQIKNYYNLGYTQDEISDMLGYSASTINKVLSE